MGIDIVNTAMIYSKSMELLSGNEIKVNTPVQPIKEKGSTRIQSKLLSILGAAAIAVGNLVHPQSAQAQEQNHPFNNRSREVLLVCANENQPVNFYARTLWEIRVNGRDFNYGGNFAVAVGNREKGQSILAMVGSDNVDSTYGVIGSINSISLERGEVLTIDKSDARFTPGIYRFYHPNIPNLQRFTMEQLRDNLLETCYTENHIPQYPLPRI